MITYLAKLGELTLKGSNLHEFERLLYKNTKDCLKHSETQAAVTVRAGRLYIECEEGQCKNVVQVLSHLLGITGWARALTCNKDIDEIKKTVRFAAENAKKIRECKSFKIEARRADKNFPLNSYEIACKAASAIFDDDFMTVDVHNPDLKIFVEVREKCYIYTDAQTGCRGLPVGCSGKGLLLLSGGLDSPVAGYRLMRRGMKIECVYFHSYPYTSIEAQQKVESLAAQISKYGIQTYLNIIPFTDVQMKIKEKAPQEWTTLMLRVCMMKVSNMLANRVHADAIVTGESLGQVASQTIENMNVTEHFAEYPLLRPLVGLDKEEIMETAHFISTYETSILPYEDCCVLFSPRHPILRGRIEDAEKIYEQLGVDELIKESYEKRDVKHFVFGKEV